MIIFLTIISLGWNASHDFPFESIDCFGQWRLQNLVVVLERVEGICEDARNCRNIRRMATWLDFAKLMYWASSTAQHSFESKRKRLDDEAREDGEVQLVSIPIHDDSGQISAYLIGGILTVSHVDKTVTTMRAIRTNLDRNIFSRFP